MKQAGRVFGAVCVLAFLAMPTPIVSAKILTTEGRGITVQTKVLHTHYILVNDQGIITRIDSNTTSEARPRIFLGQVAPGKERPITEGIYKQYRELIPTGKTRVGTVYQRVELPLLPIFDTRGEVAETGFLAFIRR